MAIRGDYDNDNRNDNHNDDHHTDHDDGNGRRDGVDEASRTPRFTTTLTHQAKTPRRQPYDQYHDVMPFIYQVIAHCPVSESQVVRRLCGTTQCARTNNSAYAD